jgi:hypothetical protein
MLAARDDWKKSDREIQGLDPAAALRSRQQPVLQMDDHPPRRN